MSNVLSMVLTGRGAAPPLIKVNHAIFHRRISARTCRQFDYHQAVTGRQRNANYRDHMGLVQMQHVRYGDKQFSWNGRIKDKPQLFGQHMGSQGRWSSARRSTPCRSMRCCPRIG